MNPPAKPTRTRLRAPATRLTAPARMTRLAKLREMAHLTLDDVAHDTGATRSAVCRWEQLRADPQRCYRASYAKALKITTGELGRIIYEDSAS